MVLMQNVNGCRVNTYGKIGYETKKKGKRNNGFYSDINNRFIGSKNLLFFV